jgi:hypothetical protein
MQECLAQSIRSQLDKDFREKCPCPGYKFRRVIARFGKPDTKQDRVEVYPTTNVQVTAINSWAPTPLEEAEPRSIIR